ncbi:MAG TPA: asparagine synthase (glutamine-hydrolyzing) [Phycisphaerales bacterium]|nr:asparagine synthase (glutamine-hydrolyzing) [Phycisphaerales bacterium]
MCGIGGIVRRDGGAIPEAWLDAIDARIAHRGPDGFGRFRDRIEIEVDGTRRTVEVALVHRRLSILDHAGGAQPMVSEVGRDATEGLIAVVFNGCIYNHRQLREELIAEGHRFQSDHSDTEVLIHGYRQWGRELTDHLEGMYAFALWDRAAASLVLARDWFGEKPLYVRMGIGETANVIAFSSDALSLAQLKQDAEGDALPWAKTYLQLGYNWRGGTIFAMREQSVHALPPTIRTTVETLIPRRPREGHSQRDFEAMIERAVERRLEADVPLGCFLSGGVDSSLIAHFARQYQPDLRTFCVKMPDSRYDESAHAKAVAAHLGTKHTTLEPAMNPAADLVHLIDVLGQPFGDSSILPTFWVSSAARRHVKVALSGDGGDELFVGYDRYMAARHLYRHRRLLQWIPKQWPGFIAPRTDHPKSRRHRIHRLGGMARDLRILGIAAMESMFTQHQIFELMTERGRQRWRDLPAATEPAGRDPMQSLRKFDVANYLPDDLLVKVDTASMAVALEVRVPFLDRELVQAALAAPTWQLVPSGRRKGLLREMARKYLPDEIVDRPKMGFAIPIGEWFRSDFGGMRALLLDYLHADQPFGTVELNTDAVKRLVEEHLAGGRDHSQRLFVLLTLAIWHRLRSRNR